MVRNFQMNLEEIDCSLTQLACLVYSINYVGKSQPIRVKILYLMDVKMSSLLLLHVYDYSSLDLRYL